MQHASYAGRFQCGENLAYFKNANNKPGGTDSLELKIIIKRRPKIIIDGKF